jgi:hypothetical protein
VITHDKLGCISFSNQIQMVQGLYPMDPDATGHLGRLGGTRLACARGTDEGRGTDGGAVLIDKRALLMTAHGTFVVGGSPLGVDRMGCDPCISPYPLGTAS